MEETYTYSIANDFPGGAVNASKMHNEIVEDDTITTQIDRVDTDGDALHIVFQAELSVEEKTALDGDTTGPAGGLIALHDNSPSPSEVELSIAGVSPTADGALPQAPIIVTPGFRLNDRDIKVVTGTFNNAHEDLKVNPSDMMRSDWGEVAFDSTPGENGSPTGVFKWDSGTSTWKRCIDESDANTNGQLSIWDYQANDGVDPIKYSIRGGTLWVDETLPDTNKWDYQVYAIGAPGVANISFFDGYLYPYKGTWMRTENPTAIGMDPTLSAAASVIRLYMYYPAGTSHSHVFRFLLYRSP